MNGHGWTMLFIILISVRAAIEPVFDGKGVNHVEYIAILNIGIAERQQGGTDKPLAGRFGAVLEHIIVQFDI